MGADAVKDFILAMDTQTQAETMLADGAWDDDPTFKSTVEGLVADGLTYHGSVVSAVGEYKDCMTTLAGALTD